MTGVHCDADMFGKRVMDLGLPRHIHVVKRREMVLAHFRLEGEVKEICEFLTTGEVVFTLDGHRVRGGVCLVLDGCRIVLRKRKRLKF
ncbi:hypothetical protein HDU85_004692 [Gaertneriomyces sp. JEL0708]|nr:hypothetical protein HDU85_004692 [Gaertneriomyces sp. JEL0708]